MNVTESIRAQLKGRRPEDVWKGPDIGNLTAQDVRDMLLRQSVEAAIYGETTLLVPAGVVHFMRDHLLRHRGSKADAVHLWEKSNAPKEGRGRPSKSQVRTAWDRAAILQYRKRKAELRAKGQSVEDAEKNAASEVEHDYEVSASTLIQRAKSALK